MTTRKNNQDARSKSAPLISEDNIYEQAECGFQFPSDITRMFSDSDDSINMPTGPLDIHTAHESKDEKGLTAYDEMGYGTKRDKELHQLRGLSRQNSILKTNDVKLANIDEKRGLRFVSGTMTENIGCSFFVNMFFLRGSVFHKVIPQLILIWIMTAAAQITHHYLMPHNNETTEFMPYDGEAMFVIVGTSLGFVLMFRLNRAHKSFVEGRIVMGKISQGVRAVITASCTYPLVQDCDHKKVADIQADVCRLVNLLWGVMRHSLREEHSGFHPNSDLYVRGAASAAKKHTFAEKWYEDPAEPVIGSFIKQEDFKTLHNTECCVRPALVEKRLLLVLHELSTYMIHPDIYIHEVTHKTSQCMNAFSRASDISDSMVPGIYQHYQYLVTFIFVYLAPWIYISRDEGRGGYGGGWMLGTVVCSMYYGLLELSNELQDPFGWDAVDVDMDLVGSKLCKETHEIAGTASSYMHGSYSFTEPH